MLALVFVVISSVQCFLQSTGPPPSGLAVLASSVRRQGISLDPVEQN